MTHPTAHEILTHAWDTRREALDLPADERVVALQSVDDDLRRAAALLREAGNRVSYAHALHLRAHVALDTGNAPEAHALWSNAVDILRGTDELAQLAHKLRHLGDLELSQGDVESATSALEEALHLYRTAEAPSPIDVANAVRRMALLREHTGDAVEARRLWEEARARYAALDLDEGVSEAAEHLARLG